MRKSRGVLKVGAVWKSTMVLAAAVATQSAIVNPTVKSVLVLSLQSAAQPQRCSNAMLAGEVFTDKDSVQAYYSENSYGRASISGTVAGPYTIAVGDTCNREGWAGQANAAATAAGVNVSGYDATVYVLPPESTALRCPAGWRAGNQTWIRADGCDSKFVIAHELGHVFGAGHAGSAAYVPPPVLSAEQTVAWPLAYGDLWVYGDRSSVMSGIFDGLVDAATYRSQFNATTHFNAPQKIDQGWLPAANIQTVTVGGRYRVSVLETAGSDVQVLKVIAGSRTYYCSYRRAVGFDSALLTQYVDKTSVHISNNRGVSALYANLGDGQSYTNGTVTITQASHDTTYAYLTVSFAHTTPQVGGRAYPLEPKVREIAVIPDIVVDGAVRMPNGRVVLYTVSDSIFAYDLATKHSTLITRGYDGALSITAQGDRIAYAHKSEDGQADVIWAIGIDPKKGIATAPAQRVSTSAGYFRELFFPSFSPDGKLIAFASPRTPSTMDLIVVPTGGGAERTVAKYDRPIQPVSWSADGKRIFVAGRGQGEISGSIEQVMVAGGRREARISYPPVLLSHGGGQIDGDIAFYRPDIAAFGEGRMAYITASGTHGEFNIPPGSAGFVGSTRSLLTHTTHPSVSQSMLMSRIYELDISPILQARGSR